MERSQKSHQKYVGLNPHHKFLATPLGTSAVFMCCFYHIRAVAESIGLHRPYT